MIEVDIYQRDSPSNNKEPRPVLIPWSSPSADHEAIVPSTPIALDSCSYHEGNSHEEAKRHREFHVEGG